MCCHHQEDCLYEEPSFRNKSNNNFPSGKAFEHASLKTVAEAIDSISSDLFKLNRSIHQQPELGFEEHFAHDTLTAYMAEAGFQVTSRAFGLSTAWMATFEHGQNGPTIGINSEMDALPELGHACGHNLIAVAGVGTAIALSKVLKEHGINGKIVLLGTPAEEGGGGKIIMLDAGAYDGMDICLMAHPTPTNSFSPMFARAQGEFQYSGRSAHAALSPENGLNALDACVTAYNSISLFRQQCSSSVRIHLNIVTHRHPINVIPASATLYASCRSTDMAEFERVMQRIQLCARAAASATGCYVKDSWDTPYQTLVNNVPLANEYALYMGKHQNEQVPWSDIPTASTDFGNVSHKLPCIHPTYEIPTNKDSQNHTHGFTKSAGTMEAHIATVKAMKGLAVVGCRVLTDPIFLESVKQAFTKSNVENSV